MFEIGGQVDIVRALLDNGASVNMQSHNGFTPLYMAAQENHHNCVRLLLEHGASQTISTQVSRSIIENLVITFNLI